LLVCGYAAACILLALIGLRSFALYNVTVPGSYFFTIVRTGLISSGRTQLTERFSVSACAKVVTPPTPSKPTISVKSNRDGHFVVSGSGFTVHIQIVDDALNIFWLNQTVTVQGALDYPVGKICQRSSEIFFSVNDGRNDSHDLPKLGIDLSSTNTNLAWAWLRLCLEYGT